MWIFYLPHKTHRSDRILGKIDWCVCLYVDSDSDSEERKANKCGLRQWLAECGLLPPGLRVFSSKCQLVSLLFVPIKAKQQKLPLFLLHNRLNLTWLDIRMTRLVIQLVYIATFYVKVTRNTIIMSFMGKK